MTHLTRRAIAPLVCLITLCWFIPHVSSNRAQLGQSRRIALSSEMILDERSQPLVSAAGKIGFITSVTGGSLISFSTTSAKVLASLVVGETAGRASLVQIGKRRLIAVPAVNDPDHDIPATVSIVDASDARNLATISFIALPLDAHITPVTRAMLTADGQFGVIASSYEQPTLFSFRVETGEILARLPLGGRPSELAMQSLPGEGQSRIAITSSAANTLALVTMDASGQLRLVKQFTPGAARFSDANNPVFSADGQSIYVAAASGERLFQLAANSGAQRDSLKLASAPQQINVVTAADGSDLIGIVRAPQTTEPSAGGVTIATTQGGRLTVKAEFTPPDPITFAPANNVAFTADASVAFVASTSGTLFSFNTETGEMQSFQAVGGKLLGLALNTRSQTVVALRQTPQHDEIVIIGFELDASEPVPPSAPTNELAAPTAPTVELAAMNAAMNAAPAPRKVEGLQIVRAAVEELKGRTPHTVIRITGAKFSKRVVVETLKSDLVVGMNRPTVLRDGSLIVTISARKIQALGQFAVRVRNSREVASNAATVELTSLPATTPESAIPSRPAAIPTSTIPSFLKATTTAPLSKPATFVRGVRPQMDAGAVRVLVEADGAIQYEEFTLDNPPRIVVDVVGVRNGFGNGVLRVGAAAVERVRVGQPRPGVVRVVLDTKGPTAYHVTRYSSSLVITTGAQD
jgi:hypothetical protein